MKGGTRLTSAVEWTPGRRSVCISGVCGPAPLTAIVSFMQSPREIVEDYLKKEARFLEVCNKKLQAGLFDVQQPRRETVLDASQSRAHAVVITSGSGARYRRRYSLRNSNGGWHITSIQLECAVCCGAGKFAGKECEFCSGAGWRDG